MPSHKSDLRTAIKERLSRLSENTRRVESQVIVRTLTKRLEGMRSVALFAPYTDEPDLRHLAENLTASGCVISMPKMEGNAMHMERVTSLNHAARNATTGILEPDEDGKPIDESSIEVAVIPGRAFTKSGHRLGRGNGGYDRWIANQKKRNPQTRYIGVCFECQIVQEIPMESHDENVDEVITAA